jgi:hypothetical protein
MGSRMSLTMLIIPFRLYESRNVHIRIVRVSSESDCSGAAFDHDMAAGAAICSPCQAGTYFTGSGWTPLSKRRAARTTKRPWLSACEFIARWSGCEWRTKCSQCDRAWCGRTWTRACLHALWGLCVSMARQRERGRMQAKRRAHDLAKC